MGPTRSLKKPIWIQTHLFVCVSWFFCSCFLFISSFYSLDWIFKIVCTAQRSSLPKNEQLEWTSNHSSIFFPSFKYVFSELDEVLEHLLKITPRTSILHWNELQKNRKQKTFNVKSPRILVWDVNILLDGLSVSSHPY